MQSFRAPRPTTNPYIVMLDRALIQTPEIVHLRFSWPGALLTRIDVLHLHWPETLLGGDRAWKRWGKRMLFRLLLLKLAVFPTAVVRTVHNVELPDVDPATRGLLVAVENRADYSILLNPTTRSPHDRPGVVILHGHYIDWFADVETVQPEEDTLGFVGLVRRYKGVEHLLEVFARTATSHPELRLRVSGNPTSASIAAEVRSLAAEDPRVTLDLRFLSESDFATAVRLVSGIVLPYRFMHNSGTVLAALSLGRRVLVPRNPVTEAIALEVGPDWVHFFDDELTETELVGFQVALRTPPGAPPRLDQRGWDEAGRVHVEAYFAAVDAAKVARGDAGRG